MSEEAPVGQHPALPAALAVPVILGTLYLPQSWYFFMDYPWNDYRLGWLWLFPGLPSFWPMMMLPMPNVFVLIAALWVITAALGVGLFLASRRSVWVFCATSVAVFALSVVSALFAHGAFRA